MFCGIRIIRMCGWPGLAIFFFVMLRIILFVLIDGKAKELINQLILHWALSSYGRALSYSYVVFSCD
jgi:hypothetical protein